MLVHLSAGKHDDTKMHAVDMVRRIRDAHYEMLQGKTRAERMAFRRAEAAKLEATLRFVHPH
jgi:hypothetical protein